MKTKKQLNKLKIMNLILIIVISLSLFIMWAVKPENLGGLVDNIKTFFNNNKYNDSYNAKSLLLLDLSNDKDFSKEAKTTKDRINVFMNKLNEYLKEQGYKNTKLYDPSGYDKEAQTTVSDLAKVDMKAINIENMRKGNMLNSIILTAGFIILIYGGYFLISYFSSKRILKEK